MALLGSRGQDGRWFEGPTHNAVMTPDGIEFVRNHLEPKAAPKVLPFTPRPKTQIDQVLDEVKANVDEIEDIVVLYRSKKGDYVSVSNQGDTAGDLFFIEKAKMSFLMDDKPPSPPSAG